VSPGTPPKTHLKIDPRWVGAPLELGEGSASAVLVTLPEMAADERGLVHGGFVFGLADYAAMLAVNDPNVVLGGAETRFLKPVRVGERLEARARIEETDGRKSRVRVEVLRDGEAVMTGTFTCFTLDRHIFDREKDREERR
jgi:acyl-coenzyme A thioesterase PaaI-like protein